MGLIGRLGGKKFLMGIGALVSIVIGIHLRVPAESIYTLGAIAASYIFSQAHVDAATGGITSSSTCPVDLVELKRVDLALEVERNRRLSLEIEKIMAQQPPKKQ